MINFDRTPTFTFISSHFGLKVCSYTSNSQHQGRCYFSLQGILFFCLFCKIYFFYRLLLSPSSPLMWLQDLPIVQLTSPDGPWGLNQGQKLDTTLAWPGDSKHNKVRVRKDILGLNSLHWNYAEKLQDIPVVSNFVFFTKHYGVVEVDHIWNVYCFLWACKHSIDYLQLIIYFIWLCRG